MIEEGRDAEGQCVNRRWSARGPCSAYGNWRDFQAGVQEGTAQPYPKDPSESFEGEACSFFTRPAVDAGGARLNYYADGSNVCYGDSMYVCSGRRWKRLAPCSAYANWQDVRAEVIEGAPPAPVQGGSAAGGS